MRSRNVLSLYNQFDKISISFHRTNSIAKQLLKVKVRQLVYVCVVQAQEKRTCLTADCFDARQDNLVLREIENLLCVVFQ